MLLKLWVDELLQVKINSREQIESLINNEKTERFTTEHGLIRRVKSDRRFLGRNLINVREG